MHVYHLHGSWFTKSTMKETEFDMNILNFFHQSSRRKDQLKDFKFDRSGSSDVANTVFESANCKRKIHKNQTALKSLCKQKINIPEETLKQIENLFGRFKRGEPFICKMCQFSSKHKGHVYRLRSSCSAAIGSQPIWKRC